MRREDFEKYLGKPVEIELFGGDLIVGYLRKTRDEMFKENPNSCIHKNYYFVTGGAESKTYISCLFRKSHVKYIEKVS